MTVDTKIYDERFFKNTVKLESGSAKAMVKILIKRFAPKSVIDVGCGPGLFLAEFKKSRVEIAGYDGSPAAVSASLIGGRIKLHDLCRPLRLNRRFDLCLCFEVAEHLTKACAKTLVNSLVKLSQIVIFTAATPGQGPKSIGHINEQPFGYWQKLFRRNGYILNKRLTEKIKRQMKDKEVVWWLTKNLMVFQSHE